MHLHSYYFQSLRLTIQRPIKTRAFNRWDIRQWAPSILNAIRRILSNSKWCRSYASVNHYSELRRKKKRKMNEHPVTNVNSIEWNYVVVETQKSFMFFEANESTEMRIIQNTAFSSIDDSQSVAANVEMKRRAYEITWINDSQLMLIFPHAVMLCEKKKTGLVWIFSHSFSNPFRCPINIHTCAHHLL